MSNLLPSFLSSSKLLIKVGSLTYAYAQALSFTDDMTVQPVGGIGAYNYHTLEPTGYMGRGTMTITHYSNAVLKELQKANNADQSINAVPPNLAKADTTDSSGRGTSDGNSLLRKGYFSPVHLILSLTFDIKIYERTVKEITTQKDLDSEAGSLIYTLKDCRMTNYAMNFTPGSLVNETVSFLCFGILDESSESVAKFNKPVPAE